MNATVEKPNPFSVFKTLELERREITFVPKYSFIHGKELSVLPRFKFPRGKEKKSDGDNRTREDSCSCNFTVPTFTLVHDPNLKEKGVGEQTVSAIWAAICTGPLANCRLFYEVELDWKGAEKEFNGNYGRVRVRLICEPGPKPRGLSVPKEIRSSWESFVPQDCFQKSELIEAGLKLLSAIEFVEEAERPLRDVHSFRYQEMLKAEEEYKKVLKCSS